MTQDKNKLPDDPQGKIIDQQSGEEFPAIPETLFDERVAVVSFLYLLVMLALFFWQLFDIWVGKLTLACWLGYDTSKSLASPAFRLVAYTFIGGGLGGIVNGIRSMLFWHCEKYVFGHRFIWKYITAPWIGATLALFTYALIRSGVAAFGGDIAAAEGTSTRQILAMFAVGALAGYGSREVFVWLDAQAKKIFKVTPTVKVPNLGGKTKEEAELYLKSLNLNLGNVIQETTQDESMIGKVINQVPPPESTIESGKNVDIIIGKPA